MEQDNNMERPSAGQLEEMLGRALRRREIFISVRSALGVLVVIAAAVTLAITLWFPFILVQRSSMEPTLSDGEVVIFVTTRGISRGDVIAFYHGNQVLIKRVIAIEGDTVDIDSGGRVLINGEPQDEPYVSLPDAGEITLEMPCQVLENHYFVMGDHRQTSLDSRVEEIGLISRDQIVGKALLRIWPLGKLWIVK